jgi:hypothetical protein
MCNILIEALARMWEASEESGIGTQFLEAFGAADGWKVLAECQVCADSAQELLDALGDPDTV